MEGQRQKQIPLACRYSEHPLLFFSLSTANTQFPVPHDQWFLTHIDPSWKIKHLKQRILAKCLNLPFDPRFLHVPNHNHNLLAHPSSDAVSGGFGFGAARIVGETGRPPSPITFAPDASSRPDSPIEFASPTLLPGGVGTGLGVRHGDGVVDGEEEEEKAGEEGYEEDDEWEIEDGDTDAGGGGGGGGGGGKVMGGRIGPAGAGSSVGTSANTSTATMMSTTPRTTKSSRSLSSLVKRGVGASSASHTPHNTPSLPSLPSHPSFAPPSTSSQAHSFNHPHPHPHAQQEPQIQTHAYTLIRFSTGQILEEDFLVSWYDILPHELVELHASWAPATYAVSVAWSAGLLTAPTPVLPAGGGAGVGKKEKSGFLGPMSVLPPLVGGGSKANHTQSLPLSSLDTLAIFPYQSTATTAGGITQHTNHPSSRPHTATSSKHQPKPLHTSTPTQTHPTLTPLPRHMPELYIQPYWEGWVRALRVVWRSEVGTGAGPGAAGAAGRSAGRSAEEYAYPEYAGGMLPGGMGVGMVGGMTWGEGADGIGGFGLGDLGRRERERERGREGRGGGGKARTKLEWRERWVVIRDGTVSLCKDKDVSLSRIYFLGFVVCTFSLPSL
ncbi:hypothetical protein B0H34DRAFT_677563 [Crassisporium funariophilum]|nr:hypothetical protein B0H34DRAFT_677563 [Crassisporium funariophilum]